MVNYLVSKGWSIDTLYKIPLGTFIFYYENSPEIKASIDEEKKREEDNKRKLTAFKKRVNTNV